MATLRRSLSLLLRKRNLYLCQSKKQLSTTAVLSIWNKDWKPTDIPKTPEERIVSAKKYGLRPEDYETLAEGEIGDYPNLPLVASEVRDPFEDYDHPAARRNYGEPIHPDHDIIGYDLYDPKIDGIHTYWQQLFYCILIAGGLLGTFLLFQPYPFFLPRMPKQFPFNNLYLEQGGDPALEVEIKHYTFEPPSDEEC